MAGLPIAFGPRVDFEREKPFFPMHPADILRSGSFNHVPFITGVTTNEAAFVIASRTSIKNSDLNRILIDIT